jgi:hypothetical protein
MIGLSVSSKPRRDDGMTLVQTREPNRMRASGPEGASFFPTSSSFRRAVDDNQIHVNEIWSYHAVGDQVRFTLVHRSREVAQVASRSARRPTAGAARRKPAPRFAKSAGRSAKLARKARPQKRR